MNNRIFAMLVHGSLVVKLPRERVATLIGSRHGGTFDAGKGRPMKEWLTVAPTSDWLPLACEALDFVRST